ncbi:hypothetical protein CJD36_021805 [Flavipsychrobacter stenotrophus]|uniref:Wadjet protein JetD C-terminal domain-containing protein n=1 Tax=Flavipsychrobacter stenotrophus TaxID=2077091 RepID=A0A2S7SQR7_9BACT|nr:hypothetical protein [Flavipsychrobacter stenotrophus]PQJ08906.1 hypothetical protein CJD36_021805 [Flavipsychrobacter stenotrophus]
MITLSIAEKLLQLIDGEQLPASQARHTLIDELINEGIVLVRITGRTKSLLYIVDKTAIANWLFNRFQINDVSAYINTLKNDQATRTDLVLAGNDSKLQSKRTFKGFLVNSYLPIDASLNSKAITINPEPGTFQFIYDFEKLIPAADVVIVGIENAENFRWIEKQQHLFKGIKPLFISRYPQEQSRDVIKWLLTIPNNYLHFGDLDFAGINIYMQEYKKHLGIRASFYVPDNIEALLEKYGNKGLYDRQKLNDISTVEQGILDLIVLLHKYKKWLEQELLIGIVL